MGNQGHDLALLPPRFDYNQVIREISEANRVIGSLNGQLASIPNQHLLVTPLLTKEAVASSKIEGTQATIEEVFKYEAAGKRTEIDAKEQDIREILNYRHAILSAIALLKERPIGENFIKRMHTILLDSVRGANKDRGNFRRVPVFIGKPGATIENAIFVPPGAQKIPDLISNWAKYVNSSDEKDILVQAAIAHYQFEAIHPFLDGNGRIGRLLIPLMLYDKKVLSYPLLYISEYFENNRERYYSHLRLVDNEGEWEPWIRYFLISIKEQANDTLGKVASMLDLYKDLKSRLDSFKSQYAINLLDVIFERPVVSYKTIRELVKASPQTIYTLLDKFEKEGILVEFTGLKRNKTYSFEQLLEIIK